MRIKQSLGLPPFRVRFGCALGTVLATFFVALGYALGMGKVMANAKEINFTILVAKP